MGQRRTCVEAEVLRVRLSEEGLDAPLHEQARRGRVPVEAACRKALHGRAGHLHQYVMECTIREIQRSIIPSDCDVALLVIPALRADRLQQFQSMIAEEHDSACGRVVRARAPGRRRRRRACAPSSRSRRRSCSTARPSGQCPSGCARSLQTVGIAAVQRNFDAHRVTSAAHDTIRCPPVISSIGLA